MVKGGYEMTRLPWSEFNRISGSDIWPSSNPKDSPFDQFICKHCGKILVFQMYGEVWRWEKTLDDRASDGLLNHLNMCSGFRT